jgi:hypothetical protein
MFLFFVRHFNDIDHLTPIAWKLLKADESVAVYGMNARYDFWSDYRIRFLQKEGARVEDLAREFEHLHGRGCRWMHRFMAHCFRTERGLRQRHGARARRGVLWTALLIGAIGTLFYKITRRFYYREKSARQILLRRRAQLLCFDHIMPAHYVVGTFLEAARALAIPSVALPHGVLLYTNETTKEKSGRQRRHQKFSRYDQIVVPNALRQNALINSGVPAAKITLLGSARYCAEWMHQNWKIMPKKIPDWLTETEDLKVVFFPSKPQCNVDLDRLAASLERLAAIEGIRLLVKPHTRAATHVDLPVSPRLQDASNVLTAELCHWADAVLVVGSSVVTEALVRGKPALYLQYLHSNTTLFEELNACWTIGDEDALQGAIEALRKNKRQIPYQAQDIDRYLKAVVQGDRETDDVLGGYRDFLVATARQAPAA